MSFLKKFWPTIISVVVALLGAFSPTIQAWVVAHPTAGILLGALYSIIAHWLPSPIAPAAAKP